MIILILIKKNNNNDSNDNNNSNNPQNPDADAMCVCVCVCVYTRLSKVSFLSFCFILVLAGVPAEFGGLSYCYCDSV